MQKTESPSPAACFFSGVILYSLAFYGLSVSPYYANLLSGPTLNFTWLNPALESILEPIFKVVGHTPMDMLRVFLIVYILRSVWTYGIRYKVVPTQKTRPYLFWCGLSKILRNHWAFVTGKQPAYGIAHPLSEEEKTNLRYFGVKAFYLPLVAGFAYGNLNNFLDKMVHHAGLFTVDGSAQTHWYLTAVDGLFLIDTSLFLIGYTAEFKRSVVRSVESTTLGWLVTLMCYPPFNSVVAGYMPWSIPDTNIFFNNQTATDVFLVLCLLLYMIFVSASVALNIRGSNLTNRGIVDKGPYAIVRHPAYASKNLVWFTFSLPAILAGNMAAVVTVVFWMGVYYVRAITEERHLSLDPDYLAYKQRVRYRFIPGVF